MNRNIVGRFAPSPSGYLHMGNLLSMLLAWLDCRALGGELVFRMEDLDPARSKEEYRRAMAEDLRWLGLDWDRGWPEDESFAQSRRTALYDAAFETLRERELIYPCWCTRAQRLAAASAPQAGERTHDPGCPCRRLTRAQRGEKMTVRAPAWKLISPDQSVTWKDGHLGQISVNPAQSIGDCIIRRADGVYAYQLAVSVDDLEMGITRVVRGRDLLDSTPLQQWLISTLGGKPPEYCHAPLLVSPGGKLSKRFGSTSTRELRKTMTPEQLTGQLAHLCGLTGTDAPLSPRELISLFSWEKITRENIPYEE